MDSDADTDSYQYVYTNRTAKRNECVIADCVVDFKLDANCKLNTNQHSRANGHRTAETNRYINAHHHAVAESASNLYNRTDSDGDKYRYTDRTAKSDRDTGAIGDTTIYHYSSTGEYAGRNCDAAPNQLARINTDT